MELQEMAPGGFPSSLPFSFCLLRGQLPDQPDEVGCTSRTRNDSRGDFEGPLEILMRAGDRCRGSAGKATQYRRRGFSGGRLPQHNPEIGGSRQAHHVFFFEPACGRDGIFEMQRRDETGRLTDSRFSADNQKICRESRLPGRRKSPENGGQALFPGKKTQVHQQEPGFRNTEFRSQTSPVHTARIGCRERNEGPGSVGKNLLEAPKSEDGMCHEGIDISHERLQGRVEKGIESAGKSEFPCPGKSRPPRPVFHGERRTQALEISLRGRVFDQEVVQHEVMENDNSSGFPAQWKDPLVMGVVAEMQEQFFFSSPVFQIIDDLNAVRQAGVGNSGWSKHPELRQCGKGRHEFNRIVTDS